jgi:hypothetical protein
MKALRFLVVALVTAAGIASATAPSTQETIKKGTVLSEGGSPIAVCPPNRICR